MQESRKVLKFLLLITAVIFSFNCDPEVDPPAPIWLVTSSIKEVIIPQIKIPEDSIYDYEGGVHYYNGSREKSDIALDDSVYYKQKLKRYMKLSGVARPVESGFTDRFYHSVVFWAKNIDNNENYYYSIPVDFQNRFTGYLYFPTVGNYKVYSFRYQDNMLYPRNVNEEFRVDENQSTLMFNVEVVESVPIEFHHLLPTRNVDCGNEFLRKYSEKITYGLTSDIDKIKKIYEFIVLGDESGDFIYKQYNEIYPDYLSAESYEDIFIASHFIQKRIGVCNDFAELFAGLSRTLGYKVKRVSGKDPVTQIYHMWNIIDLTGDENIWLNIDCTFANQNSNNYKIYSGLYGDYDDTLFQSEHIEKFTMDIKVQY